MFKDGCNSLVITLFIPEFHLIEFYNETIGQKKRNTGGEGGGENASEK
jgi:hypothetical protein